MLDEVARAVSASVGIAPCHDFGSVHLGKIGYTDCETRLSIESWQGAWYVRMEVVHSRGWSYRKTSVVKWPYSRRGPRDLAVVLEDLAVLACFPPSPPLPDSRGSLGRLVDRLIRRRNYGRYEFRSTLEVTPRVSVHAEINAYGNKPEISLFEKVESRGFILGQVPHDAISAISSALDAYQMDG
ncbi:hypothetical protein ABMA32_11700 [Mesorhizobium sp. VNQ89]|uniref:hypothetical protein n=1 Tax=Mesorhizobium quangtriensis TaxID=3157709 RepID=UPI0032B748A4